MAFEEGNQWWKLRAKHGKEKLWETPELLWEACLEYFEATDKRKWIKTEFNGKDATKCEVPTATPYTWTGLYLFLDCSHTTWQDYEKRPDYVAITTRVRNIIYTQKFEGASVGAFNANLIARDLQIRDNMNTEVNVKEIPKIEFEMPEGLDD